MRYAFLVETERIKVVSVWSEFRDEDLRVRPRSDDARGRVEELLAGGPKLKLPGSGAKAVTERPGS
jgi:hypothetical protein